MRQPHVTTKWMMTLVAAIAVLLAMVRWSAWLGIVSALVTCLPSFAWALTGGKIWWTGGKTWWGGDQPRGTIVERLGLFARAWFLSTIGVFSFIYLASEIQRISIWSL